MFKRIKTLLLKQFIMQWMSHSLKWNSSTFDVRLIRLFNYQISIKLLLLQMLYQLQDIFLIHLPIYSSCIPLPYLMILESSLIETLTTQFFWDCPSSNKWPFYLDKEIKYFKLNSILPSKSLWEFSKKEKCDTILKLYQMYF